MRPSRVDGLGAHLARDHEMGRVGTEWRKEEMGLTPAEERIMNGSMWADFCDKLKGAGELICTPESPDDVMNRALGHRLLLRLLRGGLEGSIDYADPQYPDFFRLVDETKHALNDNPDNYYLNCIIDGRFDYRITGKKGTVPWFSIGAKVRGDVKEWISTGEVSVENLIVEEDGSFEIIASQKEQEGNWLRMTEDTSMLVVRQTYGDRSKEQVYTLEIECLNPERPNNNLDPRPRPPSRLPSTRWKCQAGFEMLRGLVGATDLDGFVRARRRPGHPFSS
jgi:hypothetical protein